MALGSGVFLNFGTLLLIHYNAREGEAVRRGGGGGLRMSEEEEEEEGGGCQTP